MTRHGVPSPHQDVTSPLQTKPGVLRDGGGGGGGRLVWCSLGCVTGCVSLGEEIQQCGPLTMWHSEPWHSDTHTSTLNTLNVSSLLSAMWHCEGFSVKTHDTRQLQSPGTWKQSTDHWLLNYIISLSLMPAMSINNSAGPHPSVSWADVQCVICRQCVICILTSDQPIKLVQSVRVDHASLTTWGWAARRREGTQYYLLISQVSHPPPTTPPLSQLEKFSRNVITSPVRASLNEKYLLKLQPNKNKANLSSQMTDNNIIVWV